MTEPKQKFQRRCTAGRSFFTIQADGQVARCWFRQADVCGSVANLQLNAYQTTVCDDRRCPLSCEPCYNTIWENENEDPEQGLFVKVDELDPVDPQQDYAFFQVIMANACNFKCPYCVAGSNLVNVGEDKKRWLKAEQWIKWWRYIGSLYQGVSVTLVGGEPIIFPGFEDIVLEISNLPPNGAHRIFTNCSLVKPLLPFIEGRVRNFEFFASIHPTNRNFDLARFTDIFLQVSQHMHAQLLMVDSPENQPHIGPIVEHFKSLGLRVGMSQDEVQAKKINQSSLKFKALD